MFSPKDLPKRHEKATMAGRVVGVFLTWMLILVIMTGAVFGVVGISLFIVTIWRQSPVFMTLSVVTTCGVLSAAFVQWALSREGSK